MADCWLTIGVLAQDAGDGDAAFRAYEAYIRYAPHGTYVPQVRRQLDRLRGDESTAP